MKKKVSIDDIERVIPYYSEEGLTPKELVFVYHYCTNDFKALDAYQMTYGGSKSTARRLSADALLKKPKIRRVIKRYLSELMGISKDKLTAEIFDIYYTQATFLPSDIIDENGKLKKPLKELSPSLQRCIDSIVVKKNATGIENTVIKLIDRSVAMEKLQQHINFCNNDVNIKHSLSSDMSEKLSNMFDSFRDSVNNQK